MCRFGSIESIDGLIQPTMQSIEISALTYVDAFRNQVDSLCNSIAHLEEIEETQYNPSNLFEQKEFKGATILFTSSRKRILTIKH